MSYSQQSFFLLEILSLLQWGRAYFSKLSIWACGQTLKCHTY